ncbi:ABC transporter substrate-binding protein [Actinoplanes sp. NBRC 14428]|uniref:Putative spermidine/putrescine transport system substrate-binding protein n=1 Tax=Pseudosporangium ferrugineum TaxID=439699 RepID=A0A2T0SCZ1_9ACTN|nr:extracellular solute-binding protein [Pseudosporangium ferrugineum]PRY31251.1 putative spermidine/putrescine transport system substrate-binding protein [Pseudosporangium ferrugineum]BCJ54615.1 ABC transporter substrate-binding protein [Actinoplanes sp. NBRC 14428]
MAKSTSAVAALGATLALTLLAGCGGGDAAQSGGKITLTFTAYGGAGQDAMIKAYQTPYTATHPDVSFVNTSPPDLAQVKAQVLSKSVKWDVVALAPAAATQNCGKLFEELDMSGVDTKDLIPQTIGKCYVANWINASPIAYRTDAFPDPAKAPKTVQDFFDLQKFPGQRGILSNLQNGILEYPLLADGVDPKSLYPLDIDRALKKLDTIRDKTTFAPNVGALQQAVGANQVDIFILPDSRLVPLMNDGSKITVTWDKTVASLNAFGVPKGTKNKAAVQEFLKTIVTPESVATISELVGTAPVNKAAKPNLSENAKKVQVYGPVNTGETVLQDVDWYAQNFDQATTKVNNWLVR